MKSNPMTGAGYLFRGFKLISQPGIRRYVVIPLAINTLLFSVLIWYGATQFNRFIEWLLPGWLDWLHWLLWPLFAVTVLMIVFFTFTLLANLVGAPFNGLLAEAVELHLTGKRPATEGGWKAMTTGLISALVSSFKKILYFVGWSVPLLALFIIPPMNIVAPFLWIVFNGWMLALEYADYPMGNHGLPFSQQRTKLCEKRMLVLGFGIATLVLILIPVLNFVAMPAAVAGATVMWVDEFSEHHLRNVKASEMNSSRDE